MRKSNFLIKTTMLLLLLCNGVFINAQITIGSNNPPSVKTLLDIDAQTLHGGLRLPRLTRAERDGIVQEDSTLTLRESITGMIIYNTTDRRVEYWNGIEWNKIFGGQEPVSGSAELFCNGAKLDPPITIIGDSVIPAGTFMKIPYTASNGGVYNGVSVQSIDNPNVTANIAAGALSPGSGVLNFSISGTPTTAQEAPNGIKFDLTSFFDNNIDNDIIGDCDEVIVGNLMTAKIEEVAVMGYLKLLVENTLSTGVACARQPYVLQCDSPDGKFSVRVHQHPRSSSGAPSNVNSGNGAYPNIQIRNNTDVPVTIIWNYNTEYTSSLARAGILTVPSGIWGGDENSGGTWSSEGCNTNAGYWGNAGIYDSNGNGPEYRRYTWITAGEDEKKAYEVTIMAAIDRVPYAPSPPTMIKAYIKFQEVTAL